MSVGAVGVVSVISNIKPVAICSIVDAFAKGDVKTATANHIKYNKLMRTMFIESNPAPGEEGRQGAGYLRICCKSACGNGGFK